MHIANPICDIVIPIHAPLPNRSHAFLALIKCILDTFFLTPSFPQQIIALDSQPVRDDREVYMLIHRHYNELFRRFPGCKFIFIPENNLGLEASHAHTMVAELKNKSVTTFSDKEDKPGVCKDGTATRGYQFSLNLALNQGTIRFDHNLFTVTPDATPQTMRDLLEEQMLRFHWETKKVGESTRVSLTAKMGSKQDDLLIAVMMLLYWGTNAMIRRQ